MSDTVGTIGSLWRYPIKSMLGEELNATMFADGCVLGDRQYALVDPSTSKVASAKNPRKWPRLFEFRAAFMESPQIGADLPPIRVMLPDGTTITTKQPDFAAIMSQTLEREVSLSRASTQSAPSLEEYWPEVEGLTYNDVVTDEAMPEQTFFDLAPIHILTTATIDRFRELYPAGRFEVRRFRPNIVIQAMDGQKDFVENAWVGHTIAIGAEVRLSITASCPRCVMTTLPQGDLPRDLGILRTAVKHNDAHIGVYATVLQAGTIHRGDKVSIE